MDQETFLKIKMPQELQTYLQEQEQKLNNLQVALENNPPSQDRGGKPPEEEHEPNHPIGLCQDESCQVCTAQARQLIGVGRDAFAQEIDEILTLAGGEPLRARVAQLVQQGHAIREQRSQQVAIVL
jgi:hypothetical protein